MDERFDTGRSYRLVTHLGLSSSGLEGLDESEKNVVCPADDGVVLPRDRVSMGGGCF